jgi:hypothetical protein
MAPLNPNRSSPSRSFGLRAQTPLMCDSNGRLIIPDPSVLSPDFGGTRFSEYDLDLVLSEIGRRRRRWRLWHYARLVFFFAFLAWPFCLAVCRWPSR